MSGRFIAADRETTYFFPPSVQEWISDKHLARFVVEIVDQLDMVEIEAAYSGRGSSAYHPKMLTALLFYGYATGIFSSRKLEVATYDLVPCRYIAANEHPDHDTIATFRRRFLPQLTQYFNTILQIAGEMGVLKLGSVSLDGTKVKANASKHKALSYEYACKLEKQYEQEVADLLARAETADEDSGSDALDIPEELEWRDNRLKRIAKAKEEIERRAVEREIREREAYEQKLAERKKKAKETGKKPRGREPKEPESGPRKKDQVNLTDEESRIMPTSSGGFEQAYNAQAVVDVTTKLILTAHVTQQSNDKQELKPTLELIAKLPEELGSVKDLLADTGYFSETNVHACEEQKITPYISAGRDKHNTPLGERNNEPEPLPEDADSVTVMKHRLKTQEGKEKYAKRKGSSEPVFGVIKAAMGYRSFLLRGYQAIQGEWSLVCMAYNLKMLHRMVRITP